MFEQNEGGRFQRPMVQGNWTCANCNTGITELPFSPREGSDVFCQECYRNRPRSPRSDFRR
ncbi:MAG: hypothetical protein HYS52_01160 [Candidatus Wildermuthbacteria bacterium]|nr:hypothetical protein [Candidatus Wildermuthbacteria bacterium]